MSDQQSNRIKAARELREQLLADPHRPGYHFAIPEDVGRPGDPNGAFYANGRYHLMYLYNRRGVHGYKERGFCWGHISSHDLVHWRNHPDAISPGDGDFGCFSGGAFLDDDGTAYLSYWRLPKANDSGDAQGIGIAKSKGPNYEVWEKIRTPSLDGAEFGMRKLDEGDPDSTYIGNADPSNIWKKDDVYYMQAGNLLVLRKFGLDEDSPSHLKGDWVELLSSTDMINWKHLHRFYQRDTSNKWTDESEDDMCPSFLPLPKSSDGGEMSDKYLQLFIAHNKGCQYYIGEYDKKSDLFKPEVHGRMSWVDNTFFAPEALIDNRGRQIMWAWLLDYHRLELEDVIADGWCGVYCLPRVLWLGADNTLRLAPPPELKSLRYNHRGFDDITLEDGDEFELAGINGRSCEINLSVEPDSATRVGLRVRTSPKKEETTVLYFDSDDGKLVFDATMSGVTTRAPNKQLEEAAPFDLAAGERLDLRVFIDNSVVEVFANERQAIARRVYPERDDSDRVTLFCTGGRARFVNLDTWEMMPSNSS